MVCVVCVWCVCACVHVRVCVGHPAGTSFPPCTGGLQQKKNSLCTVKVALSLFLIILHHSLNVTFCMDEHMYSVDQLLFGDVHVQ